MARQALLLFRISRVRLVSKNKPSLHVRSAGLPVLTRLLMGWRRPGENTRGSDARGDKNLFVIAPDWTIEKIFLLMAGDSPAAFLRSIGFEIFNIKEPALVFCVTLRAIILLVRVRLQRSSVTVHGTTIGADRPTLPRGVTDGALAFPGRMLFRQWAAGEEWGGR